MAETVVVHHPDKANSTIRVTAKAYRSAYQGDGYVIGAREGDQQPAAGAQAVADLARVQGQLREAQAQLAAAQAAAAQVPAAAALVGSPPVTDNPPAKAAPRKRPPRNRTRTPAAVPDPPAMVTRTDTTGLTPSAGPPDIDSKPALD